MVLEALILLLFGIVKILLALIPNFTLSLSDGVLQSVSGFVELLQGVTFLLPIGVIVACVAWLFAVFNFEFLVSCLNWLIRKIPGLS